MRIYLFELPPGEVSRTTPDCVTIVCNAAYNDRLPFWLKPCIHPCLRVLHFILASAFKFENTFYNYTLLNSVLSHSKVMSTIFGGNTEVMSTIFGGNLL